MSLIPGQRFGTYEIVGGLGGGGMGRVYRARDVQLGRDVAIKVLTEEAAQHPGGVRRLLAEARAASALNHPNIVVVYGVGEVDGTPYLATELVEGETLRALVARGPLAPRDAIDIMLQILSGLAKAHGIGIVHRDLKPENLMLTGDGIVKILDFGLAKVVDTEAGHRSFETLGAEPTGTGLVVGTASYLSPEQARGQRAGPASDLFALGIVLYEMLTGVNPFRRATVADTVSALLRDEAPPLASALPDAPPELARCVDELLPKEPDSRPGSARRVESVLLGLRDSLRSQGGTARPHHPALDRVASGEVQSRSTGASASRARRPLTWIAAVTLAALLGAVGWLAWRGRTPDRSLPSPFPPGAQVVAVMSIDDRTGDPELERADVGRILADAFVQILYDCKGVQVVSPVRIQSIVMSTRRQFGETGHDWDLARAVCEEAGANTVLSGALSQLGTSLVLNATLTDLATGKLIGSFEARADDKSQLLEAVSADITPMVKGSLSRISGVDIAGGRPVEEMVTPNFDAYRHLTRGTDLNNAGKFQEAVPELERALEIDPKLGLAYSELSCSYSFMGEQKRAEEAQQRAMDLRMQLSRKEREWVEALALWVEGDGSRYRQQLEAFHEQFPDDRQALFYIGLGWEWLDKDCQQALRAYEKAYELTPEYWPITKGIADCSRKMGEIDAARRAIERYLRVVPSGYGADDARGYLQSLSSSSG